MTFKKSTIALSSTGAFSKVLTSYINGDEQLRKFYTYEPTIASFKKIIESDIYKSINRAVLVEVLKNQYEQSNVKSPTAIIDSLNNTNTFTVCTGHQLCLFTGPLYFIYKIISTINLAEALKKEYPAYNFVPIYWMASEDHDFEEVNKIHLFGKTITWNQESARGAVGRMSTESLQAIIEELTPILGESLHAIELLDLFTNAYLKHKNMADATRYLVNELFSDYGLVVLDPDDAKLKNEFQGILRDDIENKTNFKLVNETIAELEKIKIKAQVNPREINVFKLTATDRVRIEKSEDAANLSPVELSPNVVLRPLYQQKILPNLAYIGGPGELAYWLEYKAVFDYHHVLFPVLIPRHFAMLVDEKSSQQLKKMNIELSTLFENVDVLIKEFVAKNAATNLSLTEEEDKIALVYSAIDAKASSVDTTLKPFVEAELKKVFASLKNIESKLVKAEKQKQEINIQQIKKIKDKIFPNDSLQERYENFIPYYLKYGKAFITDLKQEFTPFEFEMLMLEF